jgi:hypothetical protein
MNFEINPGIIISKIDLKEDDTILVTIDIDRYDLNEAYHISKLISNSFPNNKVITTLKGIEIEITNKNKK